MIKWLGAFIGYEFGRVPGAILGFIVGTLIDMYVGRNRAASAAGKGGGFNPFANPYTQPSLGDFELNLLSLSSIVIKSDGHVQQKELDYVRAYFVSTYGKERANVAFRTFNQVVKNQHMDAGQICNYFKARTTYAMRLQILHFLFDVANADGRVSSPELTVLNRIANYLALSPYDFESIKAMFFKSADDAYKILEISKDASDSEIKKAYREMVKKYHPDKLAGMDEAYVKGAQEKFNKVQEAYDKIRKERGF